MTTSIGFSRKLLFVAMVLGTSFLRDVVAQDSAAGLVDLGISAVVNAKQFIDVGSIVRDHVPFATVVMPAAATYSYNSSLGVSYANRFATTPTANRWFYTAPGNDCTNFVSQCVWAAYGGYVSGNDTQSKKNISDKVRMVPNVWQGGTGGGMPKWESVDAFWTYVTSTKTLGPKAVGYNNNSKYSNITAPRTSIRAGDVLQVRNGNSGNYTHSVYVTAVLSGPPNFNQTEWDFILVSQHTNDLKDRKASDLISKTGGSNCYLRRLSFSAATFDK